MIAAASAPRSDTLRSDATPAQVETPAGSLPTGASPNATQPAPFTAGKDESNSGDSGLPSNSETGLGIYLRCSPPPTFSVDHKNPVVVSYVSLRGTEWSVKHVFANGVEVERAKQYGLHDVSTPTVSAWEGTLINRPQLKMKGQLSKFDGKFIYVETLYDANKNGDKVAAFDFNCERMQ